MIPEPVIRFIDDVVMDSMKIALVAGAGDAQATCEADGLEPDAVFSGEHSVCVVLTVTCYTFRMLWIMVFANDEATYQYLANLRGKNVADLSESQREDLLRECGNMCCGAINRDLGLVFPHLGMSTPIVLPASSLQHLDSLRFDRIRNYRLDAGPAATFVAKLGIANFGSLDFSPPERAAAQSSGELELF